MEGHVKTVDILHNMALVYDVMHGKWLQSSKSEDTASRISINMEVQEDKEGVTALSVSGLARRTAPEDREVCKLGVNTKRL